MLAAGWLPLGCAAHRPLDLSKIEDPSRVRLLDFQHIRQKERYDCGAGALAIVLTYWGRPTTQDEVLRDVLKTVPVSLGIMAKDLRDYARSLGFEAFVLAMSPGELREQIDKGRPVIVCRKVIGGVNHYEVVVGYDAAAERFFVADPAGAPYSVGYGRFEKRHKKTERFALLVAPAGNSGESIHGR
jgi:predicted double-glycine peptidase